MNRWMNRQFRIRVVSMTVIWSIIALTALLAFLFIGCGAISQSGYARVRLLTVWLAR